MKRYEYNEPVIDDMGNLIETVVLTVSENDIIDEYWAFWKYKMEEQYGKGHELITQANCIEDWVVANWAWEKAE